MHLQKGCYRGQETVARVHNLGRPPRRLVFLHLDGSGHLLPEPGTALTAPGGKDGERPVGRLTSVVRHHELGPIALAVVKRVGARRRRARRRRRQRRPGGRRRPLTGRVQGRHVRSGRMPAVPTTLITVAPTGAETSKEQWPQLPTTLDELVATAVACEAAGAALVHVHIRDDDHRPTLDLGRLRATVEALREQTDLVVQLSTGGSVHDPLETRLRVLEAEPDSCSLTCGTVNFGDDVFMNPWSLMVDLYRQAQEREVVPEFELFDLGQVESLRRLVDTCGLPFGGRVHVDFVTGVPGGMPGTAAGAGRRCGGAPGGGHLLVGHRDRAQPPAGDGRCPVDGWPPAGRHGGQPHVRPGAPGARQRRAGRARRTAVRRRCSGPRWAPPTRGSCWASRTGAPSGPEHGRDARHVRLLLLALATACQSKHGGGMATLKVTELGEFLREQRQGAKLSLRQLAEAAGVSNPYLSQVERGLRKPSAEVLQQIAKGLRISAEVLYVRAGILDERETRAEVETAIMTDPHLSERHRRVLLDIYASFRAEAQQGDDVRDAAPATTTAPRRRKSTASGTTKKAAASKRTQTTKTTRTTTGGQ